jgi:syringate O-demethylase
MDLIAKVLGEAPPELKLFNMRTVTIAGRQVRALRHGMAGQPGWELFGPWDDGEAVRQAIIAAGDEFGLRLVGGRAYSSNALESAWIPSPLPAVYSGDSLEAYRSWLPATGYEASASIGGSFVSSSIDDYYFTPWDLGYGHMVKFDHDFIGRESLERIADGPHRKKVTLALEDDDVAATVASMLGKSEHGKFIDWPSAVYSMHPFDSVLSGDRVVGVSTWVGYSANESKMLTLAILDEQYAEPGTEVTFLWGEPDGGTSKPTVERHAQRELRAIVSPAPYTEVVRTSYAEGGWRKQS